MFTSIRSRALTCDLTRCPASLFGRGMLLALSACPRACCSSSHERCCDEVVGRCWRDGCGAHGSDGSCARHDADILGGELARRRERPGPPRRPDGSGLERSRAREPCAGAGATDGESGCIAPVQHDDGHTTSLCALARRDRSHRTGRNGTPPSRSTARNCLVSALSRRGADHRAVGSRGCAIVERRVSTRVVCRCCERARVRPRALVLIDGERHMAVTNAATDREVESRPC